MRDGAAIAALLSCAWRDDTASDAPLSEAGIERLLPLLEESGAAGIAWWRLRNTPLSDTPAAVTLRNIFWYQAIRGVAYTEKIARLFATLNEAGIPAIMAKGWAAARQYPDMALRPYGDIDLLVPESCAARAADLLREPHLNDCECDLHTRFSDVGEDRFDVLYERAHLVEAGATQVRVLGPEDHLGLFCIHFIRHVAWRPIWLCDVAAAYESTGPDFDWDVCFGGDARRVRWIRSVLGLARQLLGAQSCYAPPAMSRRAPRWLEQWVLSQWGRSGANPTVLRENKYPFTRSLRARKGVLREIRHRWPDPITATRIMRATPGAMPPLVYQSSVFIGRAGRYLSRLCTGRAKM